MARLTRRLVVRVARALLSLAVVTALSILLLRWAPGRFGDEWRIDPTLAPATVDAALQRIGPRQSASEEVGAWLAGLLRGDLGRSLASGLPVGPLVLERAGYTLILTVPAAMLAWAVALGLVALAPSRWPSGAAGAGLAVTRALPDIVVALLLVRLALWTSWWPVGGLGGTADLEGASSILELVRHATLPTLGLTLAMAPPLVWHLAACIVPAEASGHALAARARGVSARRVFWRHALRAALPAIAPLVGLSISTLLGASLIFEVVFAWPGLGALMVESVQARDVPVVLSGVTASALLLVAANALADVLQWASDPRQRS